MGLDVGSYLVHNCRTASPMLIHDTKGSMQRIPDLLPAFKIQCFYWTQTMHVGKIFMLMIISISHLVQAWKNHMKKLCKLRGTESRGSANTEISHFHPRSNLNEIWNRRHCINRKGKRFQVVAMGQHKEICQGYVGKPSRGICSIT